MHDFLLGEFGFQFDKIELLDSHTSTARKCNGVDCGRYLLVRRFQVMQLERLRFFMLDYVQRLSDTMSRSIVIDDNTAGAVVGAPAQPRCSFFDNKLQRLLSKAHDVKGVHLGLAHELSSGEAQAAAH